MAFNRVFRCPSADRSMARQGIERRCRDADRRCQGGRQTALTERAFLLRFVLASGGRGESAIRNRNDAVPTLHLAMQETPIENRGPHPLGEGMPHWSQAVHVNSSRRQRIEVGCSGGFGGTFVDNAAFRTGVFETVGVRRLDKDGAAFGRFANACDVPSAAVRRLADLAGRGNRREPEGSSS